MRESRSYEPWYDSAFDRLSYGLDALKRSRTLAISRRIIRGIETLFLNEVGCAVGCALGGAIAVLSGFEVGLSGKGYEEEITYEEFQKNMREIK